MFCSQCGKIISVNSRFCGNCGYPVSQEKNSNFEVKTQVIYDVVDDIQKKLREIDNRKKAPIRKNSVIKSAAKVAKGNISALNLVFSDNFEEKKLTDKKQLIKDYPLPTSPKALANLAKYINSEIVSKKCEPDALTDVWKEKLKQIYNFAETKYCSTEEFSEIKKYYYDNKRKERHLAIRGFIVWLLFPIIFVFCMGLAYQLPLLVYVALLAFGWEIFLILYVYDLLDNMITSIKQHSTKRKEIPKILRVVAWHLLIPTLAALIISIAYHSIVFIYLTATLFGVDAFFLLIFLCDAYDL